MSMHLTFRQLQVFTAVAKHQSFTRAAQALYLSQPAVSMQVRQMEEQVGLPLFEQLGRRIYLTEAGREMARYSAAITQQLEEAVQVINDLKGLAGGHIHISVATTGAYIAPYLLAAFSKLHPQVTVSMDVTNRETLLHQLAENEVDIAIMGRPPAGLALGATAFLENPLVIIAAPDHPLARIKAITLDMVATYPFIMREPGSGTRIAVEQFFEKAGVALHASIEVSSHEAIKHAVRAGMGLGIASLHTVREELLAGHLAVLDVQGMPIERHWYLVHRQGKRLSAAAQAFRDFLLNQDAARLLPA
ncbi:MAG: LysR family transcriptional regulator [Acidithiobacillus ferrooxidans]|uniref:RuBisCO operon transcriptional regulator n=1 Tax=mine drainage metagenome TaxID=410659 RepID=E6Q946_9ZZZZ